MFPGTIDGQHFKPVHDWLDFALCVERGHPEGCRDGQTAGQHPEDQREGLQGGGTPLRSAAGPHLPGHAQRLQVSE